MTLKIILQQHWTAAICQFPLQWIYYYGSNESQINTYLGFFVEIGAENTGTPNAPKFVCPSPKVWNFGEKRLHWASVVRVHRQLISRLQRLLFAHKKLQAFLTALAEKFFCGFKAQPHKNRFCFQSKYQVLHRETLL